MTKHACLLFRPRHPSASTQLNTLTKHQREKVKAINAALDEARSAGTKAKLHVAGPAGSGKTFVAVDVCVHFFDAGADKKAGGKRGRGKRDAKPDKTILFIARNEALCAFFVNWLFRRLRSVLKARKKVARALSKQLRVLCHPMQDGQVLQPTFDDETFLFNGFTPVPAPEVRGVSCPVPPRWRSIRFRPRTCTHDAPLCGPAVRVDELAKSRKTPKPKTLLPLFFASRGLRSAW